MYTVPEVTYYGGPSNCSTYKPCRSPIGHTVLYPDVKLGPSIYNWRSCFKATSHGVFPAPRQGPHFPSSPRSRALRLGIDYPHRLASRRLRVSTAVSAQDRARRERKEEDDRQRRGRIGRIWIAIRWYVWISTVWHFTALVSECAGYNSGRIWAVNHVGDYETMKGRAGRQQCQMWPAEHVSVRPVSPPHTTVAYILSPRQITSGFLYPVVIPAAINLIVFRIIGHRPLTVSIIRTISVPRLLLKLIARQFWSVLRDETRLRMLILERICQRKLAGPGLN